MRHNLSFLALILYVLFYILHFSECSPTYFQKYRERRAEIRKNRLKYDTAQKRLPDSKKKRNDYLRAVHEAMQRGLRAGNTSYSKWIKEDMKQRRVKSNMHLHLAVSKALKGNSELSQIFDNQANTLKDKSDRIRMRKKKLEAKGQYRQELFEPHCFEEAEQYLKLTSKYQKEEEVLLKTRKYLDKHDRFYNRCTILK